MNQQLYVNPNWTFKETISFIKALKQDYYRALTLFSCFNLKEKVKMVREFKQQIYSLSFEEWKRDRVWEYLNGNIEMEELKKYVN